MVVLGGDCLVAINAGPRLTWCGRDDRVSGLAGVAIAFVVCDLFDHDQEAIMSLSKAFQGKLRYLILACGRLMGVARAAQ
jgi:hypothetical protein